MRKKTLNEEMLRGKMLWQMKVGKRELKGAREPESIASAPICPVAVAVWESGLEREFRAGFNPGTKMIWAQAVSASCRLTHVRALMVRVPMTMLSCSRYEEETGLSTAGLELGERERRVLEWVKQKTGQAELNSLPREYTVDVLNVLAMGPELPDLFLSQPYRWVNGRVNFPQGPIFHAGFIHLVPRWWTETVQ